MNIKDWADVEGALENIGMLDLRISELSSALGRKLYELLGEYSGEISELGNRRSSIESAVQLFCLLSKSEFAKKRSKRFHYGRIAFRTAERIEIPDELQSAAAATLKKLGFSECIEIRERLDKGALKRLSDADLARCGIKRLREDHFRVEPDLNLISEKVGKKDAPAQAFAVDLEKLARLLIKNDADDCPGQVRDAVAPVSAAVEAD